MEGKLDGPMFGSTRFQATGELSLPGAGAPPATAAPPAAAQPP
jgi:hypothetical protein